MEIKKTDIVLSLKGRDKGGLFFVTDADSGCAALVDGKSRKLKKPKRKNLSHVSFVSESEPEIASGIINGKVSDRDLRKALAKFKSGAENQEGGTYVWLKTM